MIRTLKAFFEEKILQPSADATGDGAEKAVHLATAALLVEMSRSDFEVHPEERQAVETAMRELLGLSPEETEEILRLAEEEAEGSVSLYEFTHLVHDHFAPDRKVEVVEHLWRVAFADGRLDDPEMHMMRKVKRLLHIPRQDYVAAKQRARESVAKTSR